MNLLDAHQQLLLGRRMSRNLSDWIRLSDTRDGYLRQVPTIFGLQEVIWSPSEEDSQADDWVTDFMAPNTPRSTHLFHGAVDEAIESLERSQDQQELLRFLPPPQPPFLTQGPPPDFTAPAGTLVNIEGLRPIDGLQLPPGVVYAAGEPEYVGAFPLRQDLQILPLNNGGPLTLNAGSGAPPNSILTTDSSGQPTWQSVEGVRDLVIRPLEGEFRLTGAIDPGDLIFSVAGGMEVVRISGKGDFFVKGKLVENDKEVLQAFRKFLGLAGMMSLEPEPPDPNIKTRLQRALLNCMPEEDLVQPEELL